MKGKMTVEEFLSAGHEFTDGDVYWCLSGVERVVGGVVCAGVANMGDNRDNKRYVISAKALEKETKMIKYEKVTDLTLNEIAKAMIDGEVFYNCEGSCTFAWSGREFLISDSDCFKVNADMYRKIELTPMEAAKKACEDFVDSSDTMSLLADQFIADFITEEHGAFSQEVIEMCRAIVNAYDGKG